MVTPIVRTLGAARRAADLGAVVHPAGGRLHDVHAVSVGRIRVRRRGVRVVLVDRRGMTPSIACHAAFGRGRADAGAAWLLYRRRCRRSTAQSSFWTSSPTYFCDSRGRDPDAASAALYAVEQVADRYAWRSLALERSGGARCSCTGSTSSWCMATPRGRFTGGCRCGAWAWRTWSSPRRCTGRPCACDRWRRRQAANYCAGNRSAGVIARVTCREVEHELHRSGN